MPKSLSALLGDSEGGEKVSAAQDLLDAIKDKDAKAVATAFATLAGLCAYEEDDEEGDDDLDDEED